MRRTLHPTPLLLATAWGAACSGTPPEPTGDDDDDTAGSSETPPEGWFDVTVMAWSAQFAYDPATLRIVPLEVPGLGSQPASIDVVLAGADFEASGYDFSREDLYCIVSLYLPSDPAPAWVTSDPNLMFGADHGADDGGSTGCNTEGFQLAPRVWGPDPVKTLSELPGGWGVAVGPLSQQARDEYVSTRPEVEQPYYFGGRMRVPYETVGLTASVVTLGYAIDPITFERVENDGELVPLNTFTDEGGLVAGWYTPFDYHVYEL